MVVYGPIGSDLHHGYFWFTIRIMWFMKSIDNVTIETPWRSDTGFKKVFSKLTEFPTSFQVTCPWFSPKWMKNLVYRLTSYTPTVFLLKTGGSLIGASVSIYANAGG